MSHVPTVKRQVCHHDTLPLLLPNSINLKKYLCVLFSSNSLVNLYFFFKYFCIFQIFFNKQ